MGSIIMQQFVSHSNSTVICSGEDSCKQATITNFEAILCHGLESCYSSQINNVQKLFVLGRRSCVKTDITSLENSNSVEFYFYGEKSGFNSTIHCSKNSICNIYSSNTTTNKDFNTTLICQGTCKISCYSSNPFDCFDVVLTNDTSSSVSYATVTPISIPTSIPTFEPTYNPTPVASAVVGKLTCFVQLDTSGATDDAGCSLDTDDEVRKCCKFEQRYVQIKTNLTRQN